MKTFPYNRTYLTLLDDATSALLGAFRSGRSASATDLFGAAMASVLLDFGPIVANGRTTYFVCGPTRHNGGGVEKGQLCQMMVNPKHLQPVLEELGWLPLPSSIVNAWKASRPVHRVTTSVRRRSIATAHSPNIVAIDDVAAADCDINSWVERTVLRVRPFTVSYVSLFIRDAGHG